MARAATNTFSGGLNFDVDPRFQKKDTYRDAMNIKVVNSTGSTFTVEPIGGTETKIDLTAAPFNLNTGRIVGFYSFSDRLIIMHVNGSNRSTSNTRIYEFTLATDGTFSCVVDSSGNQTHSFVGSIGMTDDVTVKIVGILENQALRRIYWTDNINPIRTLTLNKDVYGADSYPITTSHVSVENLELQPDMQSRTPIVSSITSGSLPVGCYQYCAQYVTRDGAESAFTPLSILYHTTDDTLGGGAEGDDSKQGFQVRINYPDNNYHKVKLYSLFMSSKDTAVQAMEVGELFVSNSSSLNFNHTNFEANFNVNEILIPNNTFDLAKDLAIKDNILFAANTRKRDAVINKNDFDAELIRWNHSGAQQKTRYLSGSSYVRSDQNYGGYRFLPGTHVVQYNRGDSGITNTSQYSTGYVLQLGLAEDTTYTENSTLSGGKAVQNIEINWSFNYFAKETTSGALNDTNYLIYRFKLSRNSSSSGGQEWWNGSAWQVSETSFIYNGNPSTVSQYEGDFSFNSSNYKSYAEYYDNVFLSIDPGVALTHEITFEYVGVTFSNITQANKIDIVTSVNHWFYGDLTAYGISNNGEVSFVYNETLSGSNTTDVDKPMFVLGAQSAGYSAGNGVRVHFEQILNKSDNINGQTLDHPFIEHSSLRTSFKHELGNDSNTQGNSKAVNLSAAALGLKSFKRGEIYRLGVLFYDKKGNPSNVMYMGDLQMPEAHDRCLTEEGTGTNNFQPTKFGSKIVQEDFRLDSVLGLAVPSFTDTDKTATQLNTPSGENKKGNLLFPYYNDQEASSRNFDHLTSDLYLKVDVKLNSSVLNKISGFRIVRAERTDGDVTRGFQGLVKESVRVDTNDVTTSNINVLGNSSLTNRNDLKSQIDKLGSADCSVSEIIRNENSTTATPENGNESPHSYIFGSLPPQNYSDTSGVDPFWRVRGSIGTLYSPESTLGFDSYDFLSTDRILPISVLKIKDNEQCKQSEPYTLKNNNGNNRRFYGNKTISSNPNRIIFVAKTHTIDTQAFRLLDNSVTDGWKYYVGPNATTSGSYYSGNNNTTQNEAYNLYVNHVDGLVLDKAEELNDGGSATYEENDGSITTFDNVTYGRVKIDGSLYKVDVDDLTNSSSGNTANYFLAPSLQKGNRAIFFQTNQHIRLIAPNINRAIYKNTLSFDDTYRYKKSPYMILAEIKRDATNIYGGLSDSALLNTRFISASDFVTTQSTDTHYVVRGKGDIFVTLHSQQINMSHYHSDASAAKFYTFPVESRVNTDMRSGETLIKGKAIGGFEADILPNKNDLLYNTIYSQQDNTRGYLSVDESLIRDESNTNQIVFSKTKISGEKEDSFRIFPQFQFHDLDMESGEINSIINFRDNLYAFQDKGFAKILVNSRALLGGTEQIYVGSAQTVENHVYISRENGCMHREGVLATDNALYFIDAANEKIHQYVGQLNTISDKGIMTFCSSVLGAQDSNFKNKTKDSTYTRINSNELILEQKNGVAIGYQQKDKRVIFTFQDFRNSQTYRKSISFNEYLNAWESQYEYTPPLWISYQGNLYSQGNTHNLAGSGNDFNRKFAQFDATTTYGYNQDTQKEQYIEFVLNDQPTESKKFDSINIIGDVYDSSNDATITSVKASTDYTAEQTNTFADSIRKYNVREGILRAALRASNATKRLVGTYAKVKITNNNSTKFSIFAVIGKIRKSFK